MGNGVEVGLLKLSLTEPSVGRSSDWFAWYDRDHAYSANMAGPGVIAGRLWHASEASRALGFVAPGSALAGRGAGSFLSTFFVLAGDVDAWSAWSTPRFQALDAEGRSFTARTNLVAQLFTPSWAVARDEVGVPLHCALDHPFRGVVLVVVELADATTSTASDATSPWRPSARRDGPVALAAGFTPHAIAGWASPAALPEPERHVVELWFVDATPSVALATAREERDEELERKGLGRIVCFAAFEPTVPGGPSPV